MNNQCPKCKTPLDAATPECPSCGLVFSKYKPLPVAYPDRPGDRVANSHSQLDQGSPRTEIRGVSARFLLALSLLAAINGFVVFFVSKSAIHEIEAFMLFLISAVLLVGYAMLNAAQAILVAVDGRSASAANQTHNEVRSAAS